MTTAIEPTAPALLVRVEAGNPSDEELVALTVALMSRSTAAPGTGAPTAEVVSLWDRPERHAPYRQPVSWRG